MFAYTSVSASAKCGFEVLPQILRQSDYSEAQWPVYGFALLAPVSVVYRLMNGHTWLIR